MDFLSYIYINTFRKKKIMNYLTVKNSFIKNFSMLSFHKGNKCIPLSRSRLAIMRLPTGSIA